MILAALPTTGPSAWLFDNIGNFVHSHSRPQNSLDSQQREIEREAQAGGDPSAAAARSDENLSLMTPEVIRNIVVVYLLVNVVVSAVVGFMWWNRSWKVRWVTMF